MCKALSWRTLHQAHRRSKESVAIKALSWRTLHVQNLARRLGWSQSKPSHGELYTKANSNIRESMSQSKPSHGELYTNVCCSLSGFVAIKALSWRTLHFSLRWKTMRKSQSKPSHGELYTGEQGEDRSICRNQSPLMENFTLYCQRLFIKSQSKPSHGELYTCLSWRTLHR